MFNKTGFTKWICMGKSTDKDDKNLIWHQNSENNLNLNYDSAASQKILLQSKLRFMHVLIVFAWMDFYTQMTSILTGIEIRYVVVHIIVFIYFRAAISIKGIIATILINYFRHFSSKTAFFNILFIEHIQNYKSTAQCICRLYEICSKSKIHP